MKKKIILSSLVLMFGFNSAAFASTNDVVQQLMEKALYNIGSKVIDKFVPYSGNYIPGAQTNYAQPTVNYITPAPVVIPTTFAAVNANPSAPVTEQLIPFDR